MSNNFGKICTVALSVVILASSVSNVFADNHVARVNKVFQGFMSKITNEKVINALKASNAKRANLTQAQIDKLEKTWQSQRKASKRPLIDTIVKNDVADHLRGVLEASGGQISEINLMDAKGLSIAQSDQNSDIWQGDEIKYQKTFLVAPDAMFVDELEFDSSTKAFQAQANGTIVDPASNKPIGAVSIGFNTEKLF
jgi:hypothetical protein